MTITKILRQIKIERLMSPVMPLGSWYLRVSPRMITCREFNDFIFDYTEKALSQEQLVLFERHMRVCPMCRNFLKTYLASFKAGEACFPDSDLKVPNSVPRELIDAITDVSKE